MRRSLQIGLSVCIMMCASAAKAASFDCNRARTPLERLVCTDPALGKADELLALIYKQRLADFPVPAVVRDSQRAWLAQASACLPNVSFCLVFYEDRIRTLTGWVGAKVYTNYGRTFDHDKVTLVLSERNGDPWLDWYGEWMPDAYRPKPFPDGYIAMDGGHLIQSGDHYTLQDHPDASIVISDEKVSFDGDGMSLTARQGPIAGAFLRVR